jgi:hypothetical protein
MWSEKAHKVENVFRCETQSHKLERMQGMKRNNYELHSHFGSCTHARVMNVQNLGWKGKTSPNWAPLNHYEISWSIDVESVVVLLI